MISPRLTLGVSDRELIFTASLFSNTMNEDRSQRLQRLFSEASGLARTMRPAYLAEVCAGDNELRRDVELLLERAESRTESISYRYAKLTVGTQLGPYRVETKIGEGGMG